MDCIFYFSLEQRPQCPLFVLGTGWPQRWCSSWTRAGDWGFFSIFFPFALYGSL